jgi:hypothetical protein
MLVLSAAAAFGLMAGLVHGNTGGLRAAIGNVSTPWLLVALIPAWRARSVVRGVLIGTAATLTALVGFYVGLTISMYGHLGDVHGVVRSFAYVLVANRIWFAAGLVSGPLCGALAATLGARWGLHWLLAMSGALMIAEIAVAAMVQAVELPLVHASWGVSDWRGYEVQAALGLLVVAATPWVARRAAR